MHYMPDTEDEDSAAETFWPEGYKQVIRDDVPKAVAVQISTRKGLWHVYQQRYRERFLDYSHFLDKISDMVAIGAENGTDDAFDEIVDAFLMEETLPGIRMYTRYLWPQVFPQETKGKLWQIIVDEYSPDDVYNFAYKVGYQNDFPSFDAYINQVAQLVITGAMNGANDVLEAVYRSFVYLGPLSPVRRHPRRLKTW